MAEEKLLNSFHGLLEGVGFKWHQTEIYAWTRIPTGDRSVLDLANGAGKFFNLESNRRIDIEKDEYINRVILEGRDQNGLDYGIILDEGQDTYISIKAVDENLYLDPYKIMDEFGRYLQIIDGTPNIFTTITGTFSGELDSDQRSAVVDGIIRSIHGKADQPMEDDRLISIAGYSPMIGSAPMDGINFQIASRYNEYEDNTYLWIGTPVITLEY